MSLGGEVMSHTARKRTNAWRDRAQPRKIGPAAMRGRIDQGDIPRIRISPLWPSLSRLEAPRALLDFAAAARGPSWFVSRRRIGRLDIGQRGAGAPCNPCGRRNYTDEAAIRKTAVLPSQAACNSFHNNDEFPLAPERGLADSARHPLASFDMVFVSHADNRTTAAKQIPRRQPSRISD